MRRLPALLDVLLVALLVALSATLAALLVAGPSTAHSYLKSVEPADGAVLDTPPPSLVLTFNEEVLTGTAQLRLTGPDGAVQTPVRADANVVSATLPPDLGTGAYTLLWRVTSADGHPVSGRSTFTVGAAAAPGDASTGAASTGAARSVTATPADEEPVDPLDPAPAADGTAATLALAIGGALAAGAGVGVLYAKTRRH